MGRKPKTKRGGGGIIHAALCASLRASLLTLALRAPPVERRSNLL